ncbi:hypothetical protein GH714_033503 [Hevea brasiliensis]|uniref:Amino acid transporter transmembrane domain-containing protein n=1 Tax=Hevea brasiliensis TaxID=3981 RepID=A0A6A6NA84_HEVBR|nr:hypothetical protein GH714_033503 [Hevea brasiliensis]
MGILSEISVELLVRFSVLCKASSYGEVVQCALGKTGKEVGDFGCGGCFLAPLCALDKIDSLSLTSAASVALAVVFVVVCFIVAFIKLVEGKIEAPRMTPDFGSKKAILDLLVILGFLLARLGYIVRVGYILHLVLVFPVVHFSLRQTVDAMVFEGSAPLSESRKRSLALTAVLLGLIYICSTMVPNIWTAFKFTGATTAVSLGFIFPSLIALRLSRRGEGLSHGEKLLSWFMLIMAIVVGVVGVIGNIYSLKSQSK